MVRAVRKVKGTDLSKHTRARANSTSHAKIKGPSARAYGQGTDYNIQKGHSYFDY